MSRSPARANTWYSLTHTAQPAVSDIAATGLHEHTIGWSAMGQSTRFMVCSTSRFRSGGDRRLAIIWRMQSKQPKRPNAHS